MEDGVYNQAYSYRFEVAEPGDSYVFDLQSGALPDGLTLDSEGLVAGVPRDSGSFSFGYKGTEPSGCYTDFEASLAISCEVIRDFSYLEPFEY